MASSKFAIAVHTLALMAGFEGAPLKSEYIACRVKTNPVVIRRLMSELAKANIVESQSGASGGSRLKKQPKDITLWEIYQTMECGEVFSVHSPSEETDCPISSNIAEVLAEVQANVDSAIESSLSRITLADIMKTLVADSFGDDACRILNE